MSSPAPPSVSIVIPSWNGRLLLEEMFPSLLSATKEFQDKTGGSWEVIVVDDGSVDDTIQWVETIPEKRVKLITRRRKSGFALACNLGFSACRYDTIILLNNDVTVDPGFILALIPHFQDSRVFGIAFKSMLRDRSSFHSGGKIGEFRLGFWKAFRNYDIADGYAANNVDTVCYSFSVYCGFCAMNRKKLQELGGFEPLMSPFYWEDVELSYRAWKRGWVIFYEPKSVVYLDATSDPRESTRGLRLDRMNTRNRFIFLWKNLHDPGMWFVHLTALPVLCLQALFTLRGAFFLGLWDSICSLPAILTKRRSERRAAIVRDGAIRRLFNEFRKKSFVVMR
jgi:GT2 family glycosyltransferase